MTPLGLLTAQTIMVILSLTLNVPFESAAIGILLGSWIAVYWSIN